MEMHGKIPLTIKPGFWVASALIGWLATADMRLTLIWVAVIFISVLVHELGHALSFLLFGKGSVIELNMFGGATMPLYEGERQCPLKSWQTLLVEIAGPCGGFFLVGAAVLLGGNLDLISDSLWTYTLNLFLVLNLLWSLANLIPALPLDGGHIMRTLLTAIWGDGAVRSAFLVSVGVSIVGMVGAFYYGYLLGALLLGFLAMQNGLAWWTSRDLVAHDLDEGLRQELEEAMEEVVSKKYPAAHQHLQEIIERAPGGILSLIAHEQLASLEHRQGHPEEAYQLLIPCVNKLSAEALLLYQELACTLHHYDQVVEVGDLCFREAPDEMVALRNSLAYAALGRAQEAMHWFEAAWENGLPAPEQALKRPEYDMIRGSPEFQHVALTLAKSA